MWSEIDWMSLYSGPSIEQLKECLLDIEQPLPKRTHAAFYLRTLKTEEAALIIAEGLFFFFFLFFFFHF